MAAYEYDDLNRLTYLENRKSTAEIISSYTYTLGPAGNRKQVEENTGRIVEYAYDNLYRLTEEKITDSVLGDEAISYTYGAFGNRLTKTDSSGTTIYAYNDNEQLLSEVGPGFSHEYTYDDNGSTLSRFDGVNTTDYVYDYENRLISLQTPASQIDYTYDADGIRITKNVDGDLTHYVIDSNRDYAQVLEETDGNGSLTVSYIYGDDLISQHRGGGGSFYHYDGQMSTRQLTNDDASITDTYVYDAFGVILDQAGVTANNFLYSGEQYDPNAGFYYLRARYYNQRNGRFVTTDPWQGNIFEPVTLHKFMYASNNPVTNHDPSGLFSMSLALTAIAVSAVLAIIVIPGLKYNNLFEGYYNEFGLQFLEGASGGYILYGGYINATITAYSNNKRHARQSKYRGLLKEIISLLTFSWFLGYVVASRKEYGNIGIWFKLSIFCIILFITISYFKFGWCN